MPAAKKKPKKKPAARARQSAPSRGLPVLEQRQLDLIGLGLFGLGLFFGFLVYMGWEGGRVGSEAVEGLKWLLGAGHYLVPLALILGGAIVVLRPVLPAVKPFRAGAICLFLSVTLALSAGTLGLGPDGARPDWWDAEWVKTRGGMVGETLDWGLETLFGAVGAHIVAIFVFIAGVLLLTGASVASVIKFTTDSVSSTTRELRTAAAKAPRPRPRPRVRDDLATLERSTRVKVSTKTPPAEIEEPPEYDSLWDTTVPDEPEVEVRPLFEDPEPEPELIAPELDEPEPEPEIEEVPELERLAEDPAEDEPGVTRGPAKPVEPEQLTPQGRYRSDVTDSPDFVWELPDAGELTRSSEDASRPDTAGQEKVAAALLEALAHFKIEAKVIGMVAGPHITRYELRLAPGIKVGKVAQLKDDLAYALAASDVRILAPIPGKQAVGIEVPNARRRIVHLGDIYQQPPEDWSPLTVWLGKDVAGRAIGADLAKMPHLLVAGTTGAGKSACVNAMLSSILLRATPHEVRMVLVDPKQVELTHYDSIPHLLTPVITSPRQAATALQNLVREMEQRYGAMALARTRTLKDLNKVRATRDQPPLPYILCVIDELADLMMVAPADVEDSIIRIAQKARAVGIHLVLATQSPRVDVITGMIKANVPSRIAFAVSSQTDSRVILDQNGAEALLGMGDMLFSPVGSSRLQRIQGAYIDEPQIEAITGAWRDQGEPELREDLLEEVEEEGAAEAESAPDEFDPDEDPLLEDAIRLVAEMQTASTSMLQRRLRLGYTRAGRLIDMLERRGVISGYEGSKPRQVLVTEADVPRILEALAASPAKVPDSDVDGD
ncbi:DNA translocase FtsK 4TM domain-containing protein [Solirubrobacter sp. CPCC 204708]|uniref:DNA translocase FtsK n=1 Tax=Solirubrobacter deserti TaxID=2282478 RepID=A0ABT4RH19_9ACTN|nr:DNA translocase FtsK [Solirubrobacter deserti]MBE2315327.1 DNA translocase FtsK 4TM domain-containing protein [Solirubrobacter deserti]MDA0137828.1 DNA translocase FtsK [Solirubrobacter deserti]